MTELVFYHNPRCGKSRQALALLEGRGVQPRILRYLETPPDAPTLDRILKALGMEPRQLMRRQEAPCKELHLDDPKLGRQTLIEAMVKHPILIERPIVVKGKKAALGRPPQRVLEVL